MLDFATVRRLLPQAWPWVCIDRVLDLEPGRRIVCQRLVSAGEPWVPAHFPGLAILPGALTGEALAQAAILLLRLTREGCPPPEPVPPPDRIFVVGSTRTRFLAPVFPGDTLRLTVEAEKLLSSSALVRGQGEVGDRVVVRSTLALAALEEQALEAVR